MGATRPTPAFNSLLVAIAMFGYMAMILLLFPSAPIAVYGFNIQVGLLPALAAIIEVAPLAMALCSLLLCPLRAAIITRQVEALNTQQPSISFAVAHSYIVLKQHFLLAISFGLLTFIPIALNVTHITHLNLKLMTYLTMALLFDLTLIGIFTHFTYRLFCRWWVAALLFITYIALVMILGPATGLTKLIGFASSGQVIVSSFSDLPLLFTTAIEYRLYWLLVTLLLLYILALLPSATSAIVGNFWGAILKSRLSFAQLAVGGLLVAGLIWQVDRINSLTPVTTNGSEIPPKSPVPLLSKARAKLQQVDLFFTHFPAERRVILQAELQLAAPKQTDGLPMVSFKLPELFQIDNFTLTTGQSYQLLKTAEYYHLVFDQKLAAGERFDIRYSASTKADDHSRQKILERALFLSSPDFMLQSRSSYCIFNPPVINANIPVFDQCTTDENYQLSDTIGGQLSLVTGKDITVVAAGKHTALSHPDGSRIHRFTFSTPQFAVFSLMAAPFSNHTKTVGDISIDAHLMADFNSVKATALIDSLYDMIDFYQTTLPGYQQDQIQLVAQPAYLGEALTLNNVISISEQILASKANSGAAGELSLLTTFVLAHELAHHWFGHLVVPQQQLGRDFLLESFAQFMAYRYLEHSQKYNQTVAIDNEKKRYCKAIKKYGLMDEALVNLTNQPHLAYHKGAYALLVLDQLSDNQLMTYIGQLMAEPANSRQVTAEHFVQALINKLPPKLKNNARQLFYDIKLPQLLKPQESVKKTDVCRFKSKPIKSGNT